MDKSGVYQIRNVKNNKRYVGSTATLKERLMEHKRRLRKCNHPNRHLQASYNKNGASAFVFEVIEECEIANLTSREQHFMDIYRTGGLYNIGELASPAARGYRHTDEAKEKIRASAMSRIGQTTFPKGHVPWTKGKKGVRYSPATEFKAGFVPWNKNLVGVMKHNSGSFPKRSYCFVSPDGVAYSGIGIGEFARQHGLRAKNLQQVMTGEQKSHRGWTRGWMGFVEWQSAQ